MRHFTDGPAPYAAHDHETRGRRYSEPPPTYRSEFQRDRDRIVHCTAFRRLVYKTQVFINHEGDLYRTRLTHSIEVAQIARTVARALGLNEHLVEATSLAHDLGHTPFGHSGQNALNECMRDYRGFEHNLQSLRIVDELEEKYADFPGLNLTFETREGILKHCSKRNARRLGDLGTRFLEHTQPSLEAQLANLADEIAYNNHDIDDGLRAGLLDADALRVVPLFRENYDATNDTWPGLPVRTLIYETVRRMIDHVVTDLIETTRGRIDEAAPESIDDVRGLPEPLVGFSDDTREAQREMKRYLHQNLYRHERVLTMSEEAQTIITELFDAYFDDPTRLPVEHATAARAREAVDGLAGRARTVADYIAGMTDRYAITEHGRLR